MRRGVGELQNELERFDAAQALNIWSELREE